MLYLLLCSLKDHVLQRPCPTRPAGVLLAFWCDVMLYGGLLSCRPEQVLDSKHLQNDHCCFISNCKRAVFETWLMTAYTLTLYFHRPLKNMVDGQHCSWAPLTFPQVTCVANMILKERVVTFLECCALFDPDCWRIEAYLCLRQLWFFCLSSSCVLKHMAQGACATVTG